MNNNFESYSLKDSFSLEQRKRGREKEREENILVVYYLYEEATEMVTSVHKKGFGCDT